jgi:hypothetical protein
MSIPWYRSRRRDDRAAHHKLERRRVLSVESMEERQMLSIASGASAPASNVFTVTNTADSGANSLRWAITQSNETPGNNTIDFAIPGDYLQTITSSRPCRRSPIR